MCVSPGVTRSRVTKNKAPTLQSHTARGWALVRVPGLKSCLSIERQPPQKTRVNAKKRISPCHARRREWKSKFANSIPAGSLANAHAVIHRQAPRWCWLQSQMDATLKCRANLHAPIPLGRDARTAAVWKRWVEKHSPRAAPEAYQHRRTNPGHRKARRSVYLRTFRTVETDG